MRRRGFEPAPRWTGFLSRKGSPMTNEELDGQRKIYYLEVLRASEGTLSCWCLLYVKWFQGGLTSGRRPVVKLHAESLSQHDEKHVVPTPLNEIKVRKKRRCTTK
jgi:hypothetical protein